MRTRPPTAAQAVEAVSAILTSASEA
jgi:hypothetical protein